MHNMKTRMIARAPKTEEPEAGRGVYGIRLDSDIRKWLDEEARRRRIPTSAVIREILLERMQATKG